MGNISKKTCLLFIVMAALAATLVSCVFVTPKALADDTAHAVLSPDGTLTFLHSSETHANGSTDASGNQWFSIDEDFGSAPGYASFDIQSRVTKVDFQDLFQPTNTNSWFEGFTNLTSVETPENLDMSNVNSTLSMFANCTSLTTLDVRTWNSETLTTADQMFMNCSSLQTLDVSGWTIPSIASATGMFSGCTSLHNLDFSNWNPSICSNVNSMFEGDTSLDDASVATLANWNASFFQNTSSMFKGCTSLTTIDLSRWNISSLGIASSMFEGCSGLTSINLSGWDTSNLMNIRKMFSGCSSLASQPVGIDAWNTSLVRDASGLFMNDSSLQELRLPNWDTSNVEDLHDMLSYCYGLTTLDLTNWNTQNATDLGNALGVNASSTYANNNLRRVTLGTNWSFKGASTDPSAWAILEVPTPVFTTGKWAMDDDTSMPQYTPEDIQDYSQFNAQPHTWVWGAETVAYELDFDPNDGDGAPDSLTTSTLHVEENLTHDFTIPDAQPTRDGYLFNGWNTQPDGSGDAYDPGQVITLSYDNPAVTLYAQWEAPAPDTPDGPDAAGDASNEPSGTPDENSAGATDEQGEDAGETLNDVAVQNNGMPQNVQGESARGITARTGDSENALLPALLGTVSLVLVLAATYARKHSNT